MRDEDVQLEPTVNEMKITEAEKKKYHRRKREDREKKKRKQGRRGYDSEGDIYRQSTSKGESGVLINFFTFTPTP